MFSEPFRCLMLLFMIVPVLFLMPAEIAGAIYMDEDFEDVESFLDRKFPVVSGTAQPMYPLVMGINLRAFGAEQTKSPVSMQTMEGSVASGRAFEGTHSYRLSSGQKLSVAPGQFPHRNGVWFRLWQFALNTDLVTVELPPGTQVGHFKLDYSNDSTSDLTPDVSIQLVLRVNSNSGVDLVCPNSNDTILGILNGEDNNWLVVTLMAMNKVTLGARADTSEGWIAYDPYLKIYKGPQPRDPARPEKIPISTGIHIYVNGAESRNIILTRSRELGNSWGNEDGGEALTSEIGWEFVAENGGVIYLDNLYWETRGTPSLDNGMDLEQNVRLAQFGGDSISQGENSQSTQSGQTEASKASFPFTPAESGVLGAGSSTFPIQTQPSTPPTPVSASTGLVWFNDYQQAINAGQANNRCILLFFHSPQSKLSRDMEQVFDDPSVKSKIEQGYICCKLVTNQNFKVCDYYQIFKAPSIVFLDSRGYSRGRIDDFVAPTQLLADLDRFMK